MSELSFEPLNLTEINKEADRLNKTNTGLGETYIKMPDKEGLIKL